MAELVEPSKPQNAYWIWLSENREALAKEAGPGGASVVGKLAGGKWKAMSESAKKPYETKAATAKAAYEKAMEEFKAAGGEPGKRRQEKKDAKQAKVDKKAKKEARKNSGAPKRPPSAFWLWQTENREDLIKKAGTNKIPVIGKLAGELWSKLPAAQKTPFEKRAETAKAEYTKALAEWKAANPEGGEEEEEEEGNDDAEDGAATKVESPPKKARKVEPAKAEAKAAPAKVEPETKKATPKAKGKAKAAAKDKAPQVDEIDPAALKAAQGLGLEGALRNLATRAELKDSGHSADAMLKALQSCGGLVNKAKQALLAGA